MTVPSMVTIAPGTPATRYPSKIAALTAIGPGDDWAMAVKSSISCSSSQPSRSTNCLRISGMMTYPPPKVKALSLKVDRNKVPKVRASRRMDSPPFFHLNTQYSTRPIGWQARAFLLYRKEKGAPKETPPRCAALLLGTETASRAARSAGNTRNKHFFGDAACSVQISSHKRRPGLSKERLLAALYGSISSAVCAFTRMGPQ